MSVKSQHRMRVIKVTEWRGGAVYKTQTLGKVWVDNDVESIEQENEIARANGGDMLASMSTDDMRNNYDECFRTIKVD